ncbi:MAG TPA: hypothetical protein DD670_17955 [Planctomycetaceae bacterium]|nr:hypothetical protein [Planctomycetaceae bacterium]
MVNSPIVAFCSGRGQPVGWLQRGFGRLVAMVKCKEALGRVANGGDFGVNPVRLQDFSWDRMAAAVEDVRQRACRAAGALRQAGIAHVVVGGNAVAAWVASVDQEAVRNTKGVDLLDVGLIDAKWRDQLPGELADRLAQLIETHDRER